MQKAFDVSTITDEPPEPIEDAIGELIPRPAMRPKSTVSPTEIDQGNLKMFRADGTDKTTVTFIEDGGYLLLRISCAGHSQDLILNQDQLKLLIRQMALWITR